MDIDKSSSQLPGFITKTYSIFNCAEFLDCCGWGNEGQTILIKNMEQFAKTVLPKFFKHSNITSFVRQLNMYDFHKTIQDPSHGEFRHQYFQQHKPELLVHIKRKAHNKLNQLDSNITKGALNEKVRRPPLPASGAKISKKLKAKQLENNGHKNDTNDFEENNNSNENELTNFDEDSNVFINDYDTSLQFPLVASVPTSNDEIFRDLSNGVGTSSSSSSSSSSNDTQIHEINNLNIQNYHKKYIFEPNNYDSETVTKMMYDSYNQIHKLEKMLKFFYFLYSKDKSKNSLKKLNVHIPESSMPMPQELKDMINNLSNLPMGAVPLFVDNSNNNKINNSINNSINNRNNNISDIGIQSSGMQLQKILSIGNDSSFFDINTFLQDSPIAFSRNNSINSSNLINWDNQSPLNHPVYPHIKKETNLHINTNPIDLKQNSFDVAASLVTGPNSRSNGNDIGSNLIRQNSLNPYGSYEDDISNPPQLSRGLSTISELSSIGIGSGGLLSRLNSQEAWDIFKDDYDENGKRKLNISPRDNLQFNKKTAYEEEIKRI